MLAHVPLCLYLVTCGAASYTDLRSRRVPNALTYGALAILIGSSAVQGVLPFCIAAGSAVGVILAGSILFGLGWLGGGDIKLLAAGAAAIGFPSFFSVLLYVAVAGGAIGAIYALREGRLRTVVTGVALSALAGTKVVPAPASRKVPYALAICGGACMYAAAESFAPWFRFVH